MGRYFYDKKNTVDDYKSISVKKLREWGYLTGQSVPVLRIASGNLTWSRQGEKTGSVGLSITIQKESGTMRLDYTYNEAESLNYEIKLVTTPCNYGGVRWWFICPLFRNDIYCGRRVGVLYLAKYAGCRHCYNLTYQSCQDSHKFDSLARNIGLPNETALKRALGW